MEKSADAFRTISEVSDILGTPAHVLRFWESRFPQVRPVKRAGGRRYYRPSDVALLGGIKRLLHDEGLTIRGVQKVLRERGIRHVAGLTVADAAAEVADLDEDVAEAPAAEPPKTVPQRRKLADRTAPANTPAVPPAPDVRPEGVADPLPLWAAAVDRPRPRDNGPPDPPEPSDAGSETTGGIWLPSLLRTLSPALVAEHRDRLTDIQTRLLALRNRVADAARRPSP
jgi:DNA-binding transcriptional MerR regulator